jgi:hypothetical protein
MVVRSFVGAPLFPQKHSATAITGNKGNISFLNAPAQLFSRLSSSLGDLSGENPLSAHPG